MTDHLSPVFTQSLEEWMLMLNINAPLVPYQFADKDTTALMNQY